MIRIFFLKLSVVYFLLAPIFSQAQVQSPPCLSPAEFAAEGAVIFFNRTFTFEYLPKIREAHIMLV